MRLTQNRRRFVPANKSPYRTKLASILTAKTFGLAHLGLFPILILWRWWWWPLDHRFDLTVASSSSPLLLVDMGQDRGMSGHVAVARYKQKICLVRSVFGQISHPAMDRPFNVHPFERKVLTTNSYTLQTCPPWKRLVGRKFC